MVDHNEFVKKAMHDIGPGLIEQGSSARQLVAIESLLVGMIAFVAMEHSLSLWQAEGYMRAVMVGARKRLPGLMSAPKVPK